MSSEEKILADREVERVRRHVEAIRRRIQSDLTDGREETQTAA